MRGQAVLREREGVIAAAAGCLDRVSGDAGAALFVVAEAGVGKTAVLERVCALAAERLDVGFARGEEMEMAFPFGVIATALECAGDGDPLGVRDESRAPVLEPMAPYHRLLRWIERRDRPLLLAVDDLHWADADSVGALAFLVRRLARLPIGLVATLRPWPSDVLELCRGLTQTEGVSLERLEPLSRDAATALLNDYAGVELPVAAQRHAWELCQGNPLLIEQLAAVLVLREEVPDVMAPWPGASEQLLLSRFAGLDEAGMRCARAASVLGTSFRQDVAAEIADLDGQAVDEALDALSRSGLVRPDRDAFRFAHPWFGHALYEDIAPTVRRRLHARAFRVLADKGLEGEACEHALRAELVGDEDAVAVLDRTGRSALAAGALTTATRLLEAAVRFSGDRASVAVRLAVCEALSASGRVEETARECKSLLASSMAWRDRVAALRMLGRAHYLMGAADHGDQALAEAVDAALEHDAAAAVEPLLDRSLSVWLASGVAGALPLAERAREHARGADPQLRERADATWGHMALEAGDPAGLAATRPLARYLLPGGEAELDPAELVWPWAPIYQYATNENYAECYEDAERALQLVRTIMERAGAAQALATVAIYIADAIIRRGRLEDALLETKRAREFSELTPGVLPYADLMHAETLLWLGQLDEVEPLCAEAERLGAGQWFVRLWSAHVRGLRLLWEGDPGASNELLVAERFTLETGIREPCIIQWCGHAVTAHLGSGRAEDAHRVVQWLHACAGPLPCRWPSIAASLGDAQLAAHAGRHDEADEAFRAALALHENADLPLQHVEALHAYGEFLRRSGRNADARPPLSEAARIAERCGARWLQHAAETELALTGGRRRTSRVDRDELTPAEQRVAALAADGHSNAEIARRLHLSQNTVQTHLRHVYAKLGISSRRELIKRAVAI